MVGLTAKTHQGVFFEQLLVARGHDMKNANNYYLVTIYTNIHALIQKYLTCNKQCVTENTPQMHHSFNQEHVFGGNTIFSSNDFYSHYVVRKAVTEICLGSYHR